MLSLFHTMLMHWTAGALRNNCTQENCTYDPALLTKCTQEQALEHLHSNTPQKAPRPHVYARSNNDAICSYYTLSN